MRLVATRDRFLQVAVLRFDDLISGISVKLEVTRPSQLSARHCLHTSYFLSGHCSKIGQTETEASDTSEFWGFEILSTLDTGPERLAIIE
jgi:hypothetical protein